MLPALAVLLGGSVAAMALKSPVSASTLQIVAACAAGLEVCYIAATRTRRVSVTGVAMAGARHRPAGRHDPEREVPRLVGLGMSNAKIAAALYITAGTAKTHVARLRAKLAPGTGYSSSSPPTRQAWCQRRTDNTGWRIEAARAVPVAADQPVLGAQAESHERCGERAERQLPERRCAHHGVNLATLPQRLACLRECGG